MTAPNRYDVLLKIIEVIKEDVKNPIALRTEDDVALSAALIKFNAQLEEVIREVRRPNVSMGPNSSANFGNQVGAVTGSTLQQGGVGNSQEVTLSNPIAQEVEGFIHNLEAVRTQLDLHADAIFELEADASTIKAQLRSAHPKRVVVESCLRSIRAVLEGAGGTVLGAALLDHVKRLLGGA